MEDFAQVIASRLAAGRNEQTHRDYCDLVKIMIHRFKYRESADICRKGLESFPNDPDLGYLLQLAQQRAKGSLVCS